MTLSKLRALRAGDTIFFNGSDAGMTLLRSRLQMPEPEHWADYVIETSLTYDAETLVRSTRGTLTVYVVRGPEGITYLSAPETSRTPYTPEEVL